MILDSSSVAWPFQGASFPDPNSPNRSGDVREQLGLFAAAVDVAVMLGVPGPASSGLLSEAPETVPSTKSISEAACKRMARAIVGPSLLSSFLNGTRGYKDFKLGGIADVQDETEWRNLTIGRSMKSKTYHSFCSGNCAAVENIKIYLLPARYTGLINSQPCLSLTGQWNSSVTQRVAEKVCSPLTPSQNVGK